MQTWAFSEQRGKWDIRKQHMHATLAARDAESYPQYPGRGEVTLNETPANTKLRE